MTELGESLLPSVHMKIRVQVVIEGGNSGPGIVRDVVEVRAAPLGVDTLGLSLSPGISSPLCRTVSSTNRSR